MLDTVQTAFLQKSVMSVHYTALSIVFSVIDCLAILLTFFRLGFRWKVQRFWWEDVWAAVASLCTVVSVSSAFKLASEGDGSSYPVDQIKAYMFISITWSVRMSVIFSIIRIASTTLLRRILLATAACFVLFWAVTIGLEAWWCVQSTNTWSGGVGPSCMLPASVTIYEVIANLSADVVTLLFSLKLLWRVKLPPRQRKMILYLFTTSTHLCTISLANVIAQSVSSNSAKEVLAYLQVTIFMIVCNLVVVVPYIYRRFWMSNDRDLSTESESSSYDDDFTAPLSGRTQNLTTVDLEAPLTGITGSSNESGNNYYHATTHSTNTENSNGVVKES